MEACVGFAWKLCSGMKVTLWIHLSSTNGRLQRFLQNTCTAWHPDYTQVGQKKNQHKQHEILFSSLTEIEQK